MRPKKLTLHEVTGRSAGELIDLYGSEVIDQLNDLITSAAWKGDDAGLEIADLRLREVEAILGI